MAKGTDGVKEVVPVVIGQVADQSGLETIEGRVLVMKMERENGSDLMVPVHFCILRTSLSNAPLLAWVKISLIQSGVCPPLSLIAPPPPLFLFSGESTIAEFTLLVICCCCGGLCMALMSGEVVECCSPPRRRLLPLDVARGLPTELVLAFGDGTMLTTFGLLPGGGGGWRPRMGGIGGGFRG